MTMLTPECPEAAHRHVHFRLEEAGAASTRVLGAVQSHIRVDEQLLRRVTVVGVERNADAGADVHHAAIDIERALERFHQPGRQRRCGGGLLPLTLHDDEFIAADATENFARLLSATCGRRICKANRRLLRARRCHLPL
jgi:hypothetical protein